MGEGSQVVVAAGAHYYREGSRRGCGKTVHRLAAPCGSLGAAGSEGPVEVDHGTMRVGEGS